MTLNGKSNPSEKSQLDSIQSQLNQLVKQISQQNRQNPPAQQMALVPPAISPQLEADLQSLQSVLENVQNSLSVLVERQSASDLQLEQMTELMQTQRQTIESFTTNLNQLIQRNQSLETQQQKQIQEIQALKQQQQKLTEQTS
jgi:chromosome segregation ATPase